MSVRSQQVESVLRRTIGCVLQHQLADPRVRGMVSVTRVDVGENLRQAVVFVSVLPANYESRTLQGLRSAAGRIRKLAAGAITIRAMPHLDFRLDGSLKKQAAVFDAIAEGMAREEQEQ